MQVRRLKVFPIEAVVRGYITGSAWLEYEDKGTVNGIDIDSIGLGDREVEKTGREGEIGEEGKRERRYKECERLAVPLYTPSTKAEVGGVDVNIHPDEGILLSNGILKLSLNKNKMKKRNHIVVCADPLQQQQKSSEKNTQSALKN